jgi:hypothetical protein
MRELRKLNNFNAVMAFYSALNLGSVSGFVTRCFAALPEDLAQFFNQIKKVMDHSMNFKYYRETLEMAEPPCIPYLGMLKNPRNNSAELWARFEFLLTISFYRFNHAGSDAPRRTSVNGR